MKWFLGVIAFLVIALLLQSGLLAYAMYVLLGVMLLSRFLARSWIGNLTATRECDRLTAEVGDRITVDVTVQNTGALPVPWVLLEDLLPKQAVEQNPPRLRIKGKRIQIRMLRPQQQIIMHYQVRCQLRGYYQLGPLVMESGDLFGLHR